jgi:hypothetical protein
MTATTPLIMTSFPAQDIGAVPIKDKRPANQRNRTNTINPITISIAPTALLLPDPKYAVNIPAMILATANTFLLMF